ncbi:MAG: YdcF family protein [Gammaproteobacteria bacterium]|nr:YdcF family protein [Gammaproteobacteria bacterium]
MATHNGFERERWSHSLLFKIISRSLAALLVLALLILGGSALTINLFAMGRVYNNITQVPNYRVALVLGCPPVSVNGRANFYFTSRMDTAARLYHSGRVEYLILSGSSDGKYYDEPKQMKKALLAQGVPEDRLWLDRNGDRTLMSVERARRHFAVNQMVIVSQAFHAKRALFLARHAGVEAVAFIAPDLPFSEGWRIRTREYLAWARAIADVYLR